MSARVIHAIAILSFPSIVVQAAGPLEAEHPLAPVLKEAERLLQDMDREIKDYSCVLVKRERVGGKLLPSERMFLKLRQDQTSHDHVPGSFSVYLRFFGRPDLKGREVLYVPGQHDNKLLIRKGGRLLPNITVRLDPTGRLAMQGNRFSIKSLGLHALVHRLLMIGTQELEYDECEVHRFDQKLGNRACSVFEVVHPVRREHFQYHLARVFVDQELQIPIRFESYDWPEEEGGEPLLLEEYTYLNVKLNVGFSDYDFDPENAEYRFAVKDKTTRGETVTLAGGSNQGNNHAAP
jgi:hypothetical protein